MDGRSICACAGLDTLRSLPAEQRSTWPSSTRKVRIHRLLRGDPPPYAGRRAILVDNTIWRGRFSTPIRTTPTPPRSSPSTTRWRPTSASTSSCSPSVTASRWPAAARSATVGGARRTRAPPRPGRGPATLATRSGKMGARFSRKLAHPPGSALRPRSRIPRESAPVQPSSGGRRRASSSICRGEGALTGAVCSAISAAAVRGRHGSSAGARCAPDRRPMPRRLGKTLPVKTIRLLLDANDPGQEHEEKASGTMPRRAKTKPMRASSDASGCPWAGSSSPRPRPLAH